MDEVFRSGIDVRRSVPFGGKEFSKRCDTRNKKRMCGKRSRNRRGFYVGVPQERRPVFGNDRRPVPRNTDRRYIVFSDFVDEFFCSAAQGGKPFLCDIPFIRPFKRFFCERFDIARSVDQRGFQRCRSDVGREYGLFRHVFGCSGCVCFSIFSMSLRFSSRLLSDWL